MCSNHHTVWRSQRSDRSFWFPIALWAKTTTRRPGVALKLPLSLAPLWPPRQALVGPIALAGGGLLLGQWLVNDLLHVPGGGLGLLAAGAGVIWFGRRSGSPSFQEPSTVQGWVERCRSVLDQFEAFEGETAAGCALRRLRLQQVIEREAPLKVALVCVDASSRPALEPLQQALTGSKSLELSLAHPLDSQGGERIWPSGLEDQDLILFSLSAPLMAADLLWLQQLPREQRAWLLVRSEQEQSSSETQAELAPQLDDRWFERMAVMQNGDAHLRRALVPIRRELQKAGLLAETRQRLLRGLHQTWQAELEQLRWVRFQQLQGRTQWLVAGSVFASPLASVDLLAVAVANGLMIREMAMIWGSTAKIELLQEAAAQLARVALAQGVVEWTGQTLLGLAKLDGGTWLVAGSMQALSAAYLTRVVGRSMADWLALSAGVAEPDLVELRQRAPLLVAQAAAEERLNWNDFLQDSRRWLLQATS